MGYLAEQGERVLYLSAEESLSQVKLRADRLGIDADNLYLLAETHLEHLESALARLQATVVVVDSVQTVGRADVQTAIGSVTQIRAVTHSLMEMAKSRKYHHLCVVGHVTKEGAIAGPKVMEHMVDTVLYFEGERGNPIRLLRAHKTALALHKRWGSLRCLTEGLSQSKIPLKYFCASGLKGPAGGCHFNGGNKAYLSRGSSLAVPSVYSSPRRTTLGFDANRTSMICAVLKLEQRLI